MVPGTIDDRYHQLLLLMLEDMSNQSQSFQPTKFWHDKVNVIIEEWKKSNWNITQFRMHWTARCFFSPNYALTPQKWVDETFEPLFDVLKNMDLHDKRFKEKLVWLCNGRLEAMRDYQLFQATNSERSPLINELSESEIGLPPEQFVFDGKRYSRSFLNYLRLMNCYRNHVETDSLKNVIEIGGGFGTLGEILLKMKDHDYFYLNVDIPPVSMFSTYYLKELFGDENVADYSETRGLDVIDLDYWRKRKRGMVICPWQLPKVQGEFQLAVNSMSFQEMEPDVVKGYIAEITRILNGHFLCRNLRDGKQMASVSRPDGVIHPITSQDYIDFFSEYRLLHRDVHVYGEQYIDGYSSEVMLFEHRNRKET